MAERDFYYGRPARPRRQRSYRPPAPPAWVVAGLGAVAGAAAVYYLGTRDPYAPRPADSAPRRAARRLPGRRTLVGRTVTIDKPRSELYAYWRDPANLSFMENIERVEKVGETRLRWTVAAPAGRSVTIETETIEARQDELFAWRSTEASDLEVRGRIEFRDAPGGRGTEVTAEIEYAPPGGTLGRLAAKLFQREPSIQVRHDLKRLKMLLETGEIATNRNRKEPA